MRFKIHLLTAISVAFIAASPAAAQVTRDACVEDLGGRIELNAAGETVCRVTEAAAADSGLLVGTAGSILPAVIGSFVLLAVIAGAGSGGSSGSTGGT